MYKVVNADAKFKVKSEDVVPVRTFTDENGKKAQLVKSEYNFSLYLESLDGDYKPTSFWPKEILKALIDERA